MLLRLLVPRLSGHSGQDTQAYKSADEIAAERARDPLVRLREQLVPATISEESWRALEARAREDVQRALGSVERAPRARRRKRHALCVQRGERRRCDRRAAAGWIAERRHRAARGHADRARRRAAHQHAHGDPPHAGTRAGGESARRACSAKTSAARAACMRRRWDCRTSSAPRACSTPACRKRASSAAPSAWRSPGLMPVPEIQFRKYADPAAEQLNDCGTMRWRTANRFAAPMVVRMPGGFFKCGDPWHSQTQRGAVRARDRLARGDAVERGGCRRPAALGAARQRSDDLLRASRDAGRRLGAPAVSGRRVSSCRSARRGCCAPEPS